MWPASLKVETAVLYIGLAYFSMASVILHAVLWYYYRKKIIFTRVILGKKKKINYVHLCLYCMHCGQQ